VDIVLYIYYIEAMSTLGSIPCGCKSERVSSLEKVTQKTSWKCVTFWCECPLWEEVFLYYFLFIFLIFYLNLFAH